MIKTIKYAVEIERSGRSSDTEDVPADLPFYFFAGKVEFGVQFREILQRLEETPVIAAVRDDKWEAALNGPAQVIFYLSADLLTVDGRIREAHEKGKLLMIHIDLAEGIGKDRAGIRYLKTCGADGILSTRANLIRLAREQELLAIQRFFLLDSKGLESIDEMLKSSSPHMMELMPGVIDKAIARFCKGNIPVIAGGLIETKAEVTSALGHGATAVSTGNTELWYL